MFKVFAENNTASNEGLVISYHLNDLTLGFSTIRAGNMSFRYGAAEEVIKNRKRMCKELRLNHGDVVYMSTRMDGEVRLATKRDRNKGRSNHEGGIPCDAMFSDTPGVIPCLLPADCCPIMVLYRSEVWGVIHAGRANARVVIDNAMGWLWQQSISPNGVVIVLGPTIRAHAYFFPNGKEIHIAQQIQDETWQQFIMQESTGFRVDLPGYARSRLLENGVPAARIVDLNLDTANGFFSHALKQAHGIEGRHACLIGKAFS